MRHVRRADRLPNLALDARVTYPLKADSDKDAIIPGTA